MKTVIICVTILILTLESVSAWGFFGHKKINEHAVYALSGAMKVFYKTNISYLIDKSVSPDMRRYIDPSEAARHYIDIDHYGDSAIIHMPRDWKDAIEKYSEDTLKAYGIAPWHLALLKYLLTKAYSEKDFYSVLRISADIGHYVGDINVPLHTTENYNGQLSGQTGIHALWESRLPELYFDNYNLYVGEIRYISNIQNQIWANVTNAHYALDSVLSFELKSTKIIGEEKKYSFVHKGRVMKRDYSENFCADYNQRLNGMVERQMKAAIKLLAEIWFTSWVDAGQPELPDKSFMDLKEEKEMTTKKKFNTRAHE